MKSEAQFIDRFRRALPPLHNRKRVYLLADIAMNTRIFRVERLSLQKQLHSIFVTPRNLASLLSRQAPSNGIIAHDYRDRFA